VGASPARSPTSRGLQEQLQVLRSENDRLKDNLASTQETVGEMGAELSRVRDEYQAASDELSS
jgi:predicted  nucleic acid-binding Zn-ribbon protein